MVRRARSRPDVRPHRRARRAARRLDVFEKTPFITGVVNGRTSASTSAAGTTCSFDHITPADVRWICARLQRLTDAQWHDAFRAGGYAPEDADRFIRRLKQKIAEGLALKDDAIDETDRLACAAAARAGLPMQRTDPRPRSGRRLPLAAHALTRSRALIRCRSPRLGAALALRPRRGTPPRSRVIQTQIILSVVGAVIMLVVGASLARAFGIVGAANLIRYRSKIDDPKDAGVMLCALAVGLASGVGLYALATFSTAFLMLALVDDRVVRAGREEVRPEIKNGDEHRRPARQRGARSCSRFKLEYRAAHVVGRRGLSTRSHVPLERRARHGHQCHPQLDPEGNAAVDWAEKKNKAK